MSDLVWEWLLGLEGPTSEQLRSIENESDELRAIESEGEAT